VFALVLTTGNAGHGAVLASSQRKPEPRLLAKHGAAADGRANKKKLFLVKKMAIKRVFLIAIEYYNCMIQNIDDIILIACSDEPLSYALPTVCQHLG
jgi:hypothetical protein